MITLALSILAVIAGLMAALATALWTDVKVPLATLYVFAVIIAAGVIMLWLMTDDM